MCQSAVCVYMLYSMVYVLFGQFWKSSTFFLQKFSKCKFSKSKNFIIFHTCFSTLPSIFSERSIFRSVWTQVRDTENDHFNKLLKKKIVFEKSQFPENMRSFSDTRFFRLVSAPGPRRIAMFAVVCIEQKKACGGQNGLHMWQYHRCMDDIKSFCRGHLGLTFWAPRSCSRGPY